MEQGQVKMENFIIVRMKRNGEVIAANQITADAANQMKDFITNIYVNETGGITIILELELLNQVEPETEEENYGTE